MTRTSPERPAFHAFIAKHERLLLTTHVNPDGDGLGSEIAMVHLLRAQGKDVAIVNPTPVPDRFRFLVEPIGKANRTGDASAAIKAADLFLVLDISDLGRLGRRQAAP